MNTKEAAVNAALKAGKIIMEYYQKPKTIEHKGIIDLVTEADKLSEKKIISEIKKEFPDHGFVGEEGEAIESSSDYKWIIDPIDGTTNFAHNIPFFCVSIALQKKNELILGVVLNPVTNDLYVAEKGRWATLNNKKINVSKTDKLIDSIIVFGFPYVGDEKIRKIIDDQHKLHGKIQAGRRFGAAALDLCYVASGLAEGFYEYSLKPWDVAAGSLIVKEAGGKVTDFRGDSKEIATDIVASNGKIHGQLMELIGERE
ncbi:MAG: inositol monophosphatase family protein [Candidatus Diapherotrites archaeon]